MKKAKRTQRAKVKAKANNVKRGFRRKELKKLNGLMQNGKMNIRFAIKDSGELLIEEIKAKVKDDNDKKSII